ncbi:MAG: ATP-binding cassette domain-containing protein [Pyrinomonadaceae bacterium]|nr:ATP-binding cassette domain-containing protein [Pyrinomonadaceae bacterium]
MGEDDVTLRVDSISKSFDDFAAVDDLSFNVRAGRIFGFLGPNGAGKTTTIRMIVGITIPDSGEIELFGKRINGTDQDHIGYLPEERGLYKKTKVIDQLRYFAALKNIPQSEADRRIDRWLGRMELSEWKNKKTTDLSKGMQQKIQFIATVLHDPDLLILDEPFSGLDPVNVEFMIDVLSEFRQTNKTVIFSTHLMETAERLCHDILLINKGKKVISGSLRKVKESYGRNRVAVRVDGANDLLNNVSGVESIAEKADEKILSMRPDADPQELLRSLVSSGAKVTKFEYVEPTLNDIFIEQIGGAK